jgi:hypothetical protein
MTINSTVIASCVLAAVALSAAPQRAAAQVLETRQTELTAYVPPQAHVELPSYITFGPNETTCAATVRLTSIVYPDACPRVRLMLASTDATATSVAWDSGQWQNATGIAGRLGQTFQPFALGDAYASTFAGTTVFRMDEARTGNVTINLQWKLEWVD